MPTLVAAIGLASLLVAAPASKPARAPAVASPAGSGIVFLEDDWEGALARARAENKPVFVDAWASWCHTCLSMRSFIFPDPGLRELAGRVVWVAIDTEKPVNRPFVEKFRQDAWPTFFILDPASGRLIDRWVGAATVAEMRRFVLDAADTFARNRAPGPVAMAVNEALADASTGDAIGSAAAWQRAIDLTAATDPSRPSRLVSLALALDRAGTPETLQRCATLGVAEMGNTGESATATDFTSVTAHCAERLPEGDPLRGELFQRAIARLEGLVENAKAPLSVDDRSDAYGNLVHLLDASGKHEQAVERARARQRLLEAAASSAPDVERAATFDSHRVETYLYLGDAAAAEKLLTARERQQPEDYNPPARLAWVLSTKGDLAGAAAALDRALALMPRGRRRLGVLDQKARILEKLGRPVSPVLEEELTLYRELPISQRSAKGLADLEAAVAAARAKESSAKR